MVVVLFMGAVQMISTGILGEYIRRIFIEVKGRPTYIAREVQRDIQAPTEMPMEAMSQEPQNV